MRNLVIKWFETIIWIFGGLVALVGIILGFIAFANGQFLFGLLFIIAAPLYAIMILGIFFVFLAIQENTRRTAEAVEKLSSQ